MIYPKFLRHGDTIGICAPSAGVGHKIESFEQSLSVLKGEGYHIRETAGVRTDSERSASGAVRGKELQELVEDKNISAILSASGGDYAPEMLPFVDWERIRENPKWIIGASDPTNLLFPVTTNLDIATMYGFNAGTFDWQPLHPFQERMLRVLKGDIGIQESFQYYDDKRGFSDNPILEGEVYWDSRMDGEKAPVSFEGRLIGGCIDCIGKLIGTPYDGTHQFLDRYASEGIIWYFDPFAMNAETLYLTMLQMKACGYFRGATGILFGRVMFDGGSSDEDYLDLLTRCFDVPIILNCDIGHVKPCMTLINGSFATVQCGDGIGTIEMRLE
ncbi:S66 family peptidase [Anaerovoracaceae bacterium Sow4_D4]